MTREYCDRVAQHDDSLRDEAGDGTPEDRSGHDGSGRDESDVDGSGGEESGATRREIRRAVIITAVAFFAIIISSLLFVLAGTAR
jgi:hypothetical protein